MSRLSFPFSTISKATSKFGLYASRLRTDADITDIQKADIADVQTAVRVLLIVSKTNSFWTQSWSSTEETLVAALGALRKSQLIKYQDDTDVPLRILAKEKWESRVFIVFDIFNFGYDPALGHLPEHDNHRNSDDCFSLPPVVRFLR
jgi:hypothetical protein